VVSAEGKAIGAMAIGCFVTIAGLVLAFLAAVVLRGFVGVKCGTAENLAGGHLALAPNDFRGGLATVISSITGTFGGTSVAHC
jgi:hypothetical protein